MHSSLKLGPRGAPKLLVIYINNDVYYVRGICKALSVWCVPMQGHTNRGIGVPICQGMGCTLEILYFELMHQFVK